MASSQYISVREAAQLLEISEKKIMDLIEARNLQAYRIADKFLRLKRAEVLGLRNAGKIEKETVRHSYTPKERLVDFFYYNDFYLIAGVVIFWLLYLIFFV
jgi:excisionase family DNA binding protein